MRSIAVKLSINYFVYAFVVLVVSATLLHFIAKQAYLSEVKESLQMDVEDFVDSTVDNIHIADIPTWNTYNRDEGILPHDTVNARVFFIKKYLNKADNHQESYMELNAPVLIDGVPFTYYTRQNLLKGNTFVLNITLLYLGLTLVLLMGLYVITKYTSRKFGRELNDTLKKVDEFDISKGVLPHFERTNTLELAYLADSAGNRMRKNIAIHNAQREFIENAAHELQTPLAVLQAKLDLLIQDAELDEEKSAIFESLNDCVSRMKRLNRNLLLLSKMDQLYADVQDIVLNDLLQKQLCFFEEQAEIKALHLSVNLTEPVILNANITLVDVLVSNLLMNAIRHNNRNGDLMVRTTQKPSLLIGNTGNNEMLDEERLFDPFHRMQGAGSGSGLGLSIVKKIVELNHWTIGYRFEKGTHYFEVFF